MKRGELLRKLRIDNGHTQKEVAERIGVQRAYNPDRIKIFPKIFPKPLAYIYTMVYNKIKERI